jgi:hypothetical protein
MHVYHFNQNLYSSALLIPQQTYAYCGLFYCCMFKKNWCKLPEDGVTIRPKHVAVMYKIVHIHHTLVHLLVLLEFHFVILHGMNDVKLG